MYKQPTTKPITECDVRRAVEDACYSCKYDMRDAWNDGGLYEWLDENILNVDYLMIDPYDRFHVMGCVLTYVFGGPTVRVDTFNHCITGTWGISDCVIHFDEDMADAITNYYA